MRKHIVFGLKDRGLIKGFFAIFLKNFNFEKECETKTFLIVHDLPCIFCDKRKKKTHARNVCLQKIILTVFGEAQG